LVIGLAGTVGGIWFCPPAIRIAAGRRPATGAWAVPAGRLLW